MPGGDLEAKVLEKRDRLEYVGVVVDDVACPQQADPGIALGDGHGGTVECAQGAFKFRPSSLPQRAWYVQMQTRTQASRTGGISRIDQSIPEYFKAQSSKPTIHLLFVNYFGIMYNVVQMGAARS